MLSFLENPKKIEKKKTKRARGLDQSDGPTHMSFNFLCSSSDNILSTLLFLKNKASDVSFACPSFGHRRDC